MQGKILVIGVGGGNDSISSLFIQEHLIKTGVYNPEFVDILSISPSSCSFKNIKLLTDRLFLLSNETKRIVSGKETSKFPDAELNKYKDKISFLKIRNVYCATLKNGTQGFQQDITFLIEKNKYDLIIAIDVGGDFISIANNKNVLSPMMDGIVCYSLQKLSDNYKIIYIVFGLGTDGESTTEQLDLALKAAKPSSEGLLTKETISESESFYREFIEPNRYSRTADFILKEVFSEHNNPSDYRARFVYKDNVFYSIYQHYIDPKFFGKYYIIEDIKNIKNNFTIECESEADWFFETCQDIRFNSEINGQIIRHHEYELLFFTPSIKFSQEQIKNIFSKLQNGSGYIVIYEEHLPLVHIEYKEIKTIGRIKILYV